MRVSTSRAIALGLLGRHVLRRADELAGLGEQRFSVSLLADRLGDAEVDHLHARLAVLSGHQDVRRLEIAMDDRLLMRVLHRIARLDEQLQPLLHRAASDDRRRT